MFVKAQINGTLTKALVDLGASHNFLSSDEVQRLGVKIINEGGSMKVVNSSSQTIQRVARGVKASIGQWTG